MAAATWAWKTKDEGPSDTVEGILLPCPQNELPKPLALQVAPTVAPPNAHCVRRRGRVDGDVDGRAAAELASTERRRLTPPGEVDVYALTMPSALPVPTRRDSPPAPPPPPSRGPSSPPPAAAVPRIPSPFTLTLTSPDARRREMKVEGNTELPNNE